MINTKTTINIYTNDSKCEMLIANLYVVARGERFFKLSLHGTPYNVFENRDHTNILSLEMFMVRQLLFCTPNNDWYAG